MPIRERRIRRTPRSRELRPSEFHLLATGEEQDFFVFDWTGLDIDCARKLFESVRGAYPPGTFPWAEAKFSGVKEKKTCPPE